MLLLVIAVFGLLISEVFLDNSWLDSKFYQNDYKLEFERAELLRFNKPYVKHFKVTTFKYNRTCPLVNATYEYGIDIDHDAEVIVQAYVFLSNEYRDFPLRFEFNFCHAYSKNYAGLATFATCGNFTGCPVKKGRIYHHCNWTPNPSLFPPLIPNGNYMVELQALYHDVELYVIRGYVKVSRPIPIPKK